MSVRFRWPQIVAVAVVFGAGWGAAALSRGRAPVSSPHVEAVMAMETTCTDPAAMEANANLVREVSDYRRRLADAQEQRAEAEAKIARAAAKDNERLSASTDEWKRMAREGTVRVRIPCSSWDGAGRFSLRRATRGHSGSHVMITSRHFEKMQRAEAAGFSSEELETLSDVYHRVNARTWASVRASCEASAEFRESIALDDEPTDDSRLATCRSLMVDVNQPEGRSAVAHFAALRAAGAPIQRAANDSERLLFALTDTQQRLEDEMVSAFGREKTTRAIDNGVMCFDETTYDTHDPSSDG